jgi:hypothetical protein
MRVEGNSHPGNGLTGDDLPEPKYCPVCGRAIWRVWAWTTVDKSSAYPMFVCYGRRPGWNIWLCQRFSIVSPEGAHYTYRLPEYRFSEDDALFDRETGTERPRFR